MNITWKVTNTDYLTADGFITCAHWTATATDDGYTASVYSTCSWQPGAPSIPYAQVTEAEVLAWVWGSGVDKAATEAALAAQIEAQKNPPVQQGLPWAA